MAWGGRRPGSGAKPKSDNLRVLRGLPSRQNVVQMPQSMAQSPPVDELSPPAGMGEAEKAVWLRQAPIASKARTLVPATALSFERYCRMVVLEASIMSDPAKAAGSDHRGLLQRINALELQFCLTPCGKALLDQSDTVQAPSNPLDRFLKKAAH